MTNPLADLKTFLDAHAAPPPRPGDYVAYLDESDPSAGVGLFRAGGSLAVGMSTEAYEAFCAHPSVMAVTDPGAKR